MRQPLRSAKISLDALRGTVEIDGEKLGGVTGITLTHRVGHLPQLEVSLNMSQLDILSGDTKVEVYLPERVRLSLMRLGWTPPSDGA